MTTPEDTFRTVTMTLARAPWPMETPDDFDTLAALVTKALVEDADNYKAAMKANLERALTAERIANEMAKSLNWAIAEIEKRAEYTALGQFDSLLARAKHDRDSINRLKPPLP